MDGIEELRPCAWMSGPRDASVKVSPAKWWFAISRDMITRSVRSQRTMVRTPVSCDRTPSFASPLGRK